jgi:hypothetical protein
LAFLALVVRVDFLLPSARLFVAPELLLGLVAFLSFGFPVLSVFALGLPVAPALPFESFTSFPLAADLGFSSVFFGLFVVEALGFFDELDTVDFPLELAAGVVFTFDSFGLFPLVGSAGLASRSVKKSKH